jgi:dihydroorotate dehydrogenase (fumarate)
MADLHSSYLGLDLKNPLVPSSSPLTGNIDSARQLEDAGAAAIIMPSLFEEVILAEQDRLDRFLDQQSIGHGEADSFRPIPHGFKSSEESYLERLAELKNSLDIPVIASLNGTSAGGWLSHALALQDAGADALELNVYYIAGDPADTAESVEQRYIDIAQALVRKLEIPVTVKLAEQFTAPLAVVRRLEEAGVAGVSLFNRFYQPDIDLESLEVVPRLSLSTPAEALLRIRWVAMLCGHTRCGIAVTGGFHSAADALKALLAGASAVHLCSLLLQEGAGAISTVLGDMAQWLEENEYDSIEQLRGSVSGANAPNPAAYARANYIDVLENYAVPAGVRH